MSAKQRLYQGLTRSGHSLFLFGLSVGEEDRFVFSSQLPTFPIVVINPLSSSPIMLFLGSSSFPKASSMVITLNCLPLVRTSPLSLSHVPMTSPLYLSQWGAEGTVLRPGTEGLPPSPCPDPPFTGWKDGPSEASSFWEGHPWHEEGNLVRWCCRWK